MTYIQEFVTHVSRVYGVKTVQMLAVIVVVNIAVFWMVYAKNVKTATGAILVSTSAMVSGVIIHFVRKTQGTVHYVKPITGEISASRLVTSATVLVNLHALKLQAQHAIRVSGASGASDVRHIALPTV